MISGFIFLLTNWLPNNFTRDFLPTRSCTVDPGTVCLSGTQSQIRPSGHIFFEIARNLKSNIGGETDSLESSFSDIFQNSVCEILCIWCRTGPNRVVPKVPPGGVGPGLKFSGVGRLGIDLV